jgi:hypothetical protein
MNNIWGEKVNRTENKSENRYTLDYNQIALKIEKYIEYIEEFGKKINSLKNISKDSKNKTQQYIVNCQNLIKDIEDIENLFKNQNLDSNQTKQLKKVQNQYKELKIEFSKVKESKKYKEIELNQNKKNGKINVKKYSFESDDDEKEETYNYNNKNYDEKEFQKVEKTQKKEKPVLSFTVESTLDVEEKIAQETNREITYLKTEMEGLQEIFKDINTLVHEQDASIDIIQENIQDSNMNTENAVEDINVSANFTISGFISKLFGN